MSGFKLLIVLLAATCIGCIAYDAYNKSATLEYLPTDVKVERWIYNDYLRSRSIIKFDKQTIAKLNKSNNLYFSQPLAARKAASSGIREYIGWWKTPLLRDANGKQAFSAAAAARMPGDYSEHLAGLAAFRSLNSLKGEAGQSYQHLNNTLSKSGSFFTFSRSGEIFIVVDPETGLAAITIGDN